MLYCRPGFAWGEQRVKSHVICQCSIFKPGFKKMGQIFFLVAAPSSLRPSVKSVSQKFGTRRFGHTHTLVMGGEGSMRGGSGRVGEGLEGAYLGGAALKGAAVSLAANPTSSLTHRPLLWQRLILPCFSSYSLRHGQFRRVQPARTGVTHVRGIRIELPPRRVYPQSTLRHPPYLKPTDYTAADTCGKDQCSTCEV